MIFNADTHYPASLLLQWSLSRLMTTLNQANPYFIRCIKSNSEKVRPTSSLSKIVDGTELKNEQVDHVDMFYYFRQIQKF